jgi:hypothetical protein
MLAIRWVIVVRTAKGGTNALVNRSARKGSMICYRPSANVGADLPLSQLGLRFCRQPQKRRLPPWCPRTRRRRDMRFRKRTVVLDSSRIDTPLVIPLERAAVIEFMIIPGAAPSSSASVRAKLLPAPAGDVMI